MNVSKSTASSLYQCALKCKVFQPATIRFLNRRKPKKNLPLPWREGIKGGLNLVHRLPMFVVAQGGGIIIGCFYFIFFHPHPTPPPSRGRGLWGYWTASLCPLPSGFRLLNSHSYIVPFILHSFCFRFHPRVWYYLLQRAATYRGLAIHVCKRFRHRNEYFTQAI